MDQYWKSLSNIISILVSTQNTEEPKHIYQRVLNLLHKAIPFDGAVLSKVEDRNLTPIATQGMTTDSAGRMYPIEDHPRLKIICQAKHPVRFPADSSLPDPFEGLLYVDPDGLDHIHACCGIPIYQNDSLVALLNFDALNPHAFDNLTDAYLSMLGNLIGMHLHQSQLIHTIQERIAHKDALTHELLHESMLNTQEIIGESDVMKKLRKEIQLVAQSDYTVLIEGATGTGKELVARSLHKYSQQKDHPMLYLNCAALPESLAESELFGHTKGAFTGADRNRVGKFELANNGTLFLDEIGELPLSIQAKLLRAIQEGEVQPVGSEKTIKTNVRLIAATNRNLKQEVEKGHFRRDLFHRLDVYPISVPALKDRLSDIPLLAGFFIEKLQRRLGIPALRISQKALQLLQAYSWPGNVRELDNLIARAALKASITAQNHRHGLIYIEEQHLADDLTLSTDAPIPTASKTNKEKDLNAPNLSLREQTKAFQRQRIQACVAKHKGNWAAAARELGMNRGNLHNLAKRLQIIK